MECGRCGTELIPGKSFCHACGAAATACVKCGNRLQPEFRFCPDCGTPVEAEPGGAATSNPSPGVSPSAPPEVPIQRVVVEGERKLVTVFFCDLAGSTAIAERLDPEEYRELLEQYVALAFREIYRFEGIVNQLAGDGMMALFGAPVAREDAPVRAVWAALAIQEELTRLNETLRESGKPELRARIGIHTGPVVVGTVGNDQKMDYTAIGDTTNLAARLESLAAPGSILVSSATHGLVRGFFQMRSAGPYEVKGKVEPVPAFEVLGRREAVSPIALAAERGLTPLVGREQELTQLQSCYERAAAGLPQVVSIVGETGSGRSRLIYEMKRRLVPEPRIFEARCVALNQRVPFYPWIAMLQQYFGIAENDPPEVAIGKLRQRLAELGPAVEERAELLEHMLIRPTDEPADLPEIDLKRATFDAVGQLFAAEAETFPVVVIIEDLQWVDGPSRMMIERAIATMHHARLMFVLSYRPDFAAGWSSQAVLTQIRLRRLSDDDAVAIIRNLAGGPLPAELESLILGKAEGSPFYAEEITRSLLESGAVAVDPEGQRLTRPIEEIELPGTVQEVIAARLDTLDPEAKRVVQVAAVIGRQFRRDQIESLLNGDGVGVDRALAELERRGIVHRKSVFSDADYRFGESLTQEVAYEGLLLRQRRQLHARAGQLLEAAAGEWTPERSARLAYHYANSDDPERAAQALLRAAADAEKVPSYQAATAYYREAWDVASAASDASEPLRRLAVAAAHGLGRMSVIYNAIGIEDMPGVLRTAAGMAEALGELSDQTTLLTYCGMETMTRTPGKFDEGLALVEETLARAELAGLTPVGVERALAWAYLLDGRFELARRTISRAVAQLAETKHGKSLADLYVGTLYLRDRIDLYRGNLDDALREAEVTRRIGQRAGNRTVQSGSAGTMAVVHLLRGAYDEALRWADEALYHSRAIGNPFGRHSEAAIAVLAMHHAGGAHSRKRYPEVFDADIPIDGDRSTSLPWLVAACLVLGEVDRATDMGRVGYEKAAGRFRRMVAARAWAHALSAGPESDWAQSAALYDEAIALADAIGSPVDRAHARIGAAELAVRRGADELMVREWLAEAEIECRLLGMKPDLDRIGALLFGSDVAAASHG